MYYWDGGRSLDLFGYGNVDVHSRVQSREKGKRRRKEKEEPEREKEGEEGRGDAYVDKKKKTTDC